MKGSARRICAILVLVGAVTDTFANKPSKVFQKFPPIFQRGLRSAHGGQPFIPPLHKQQQISPFQLAPVTQAPETLDPYACLPKYLCVIQNKKGEKRTTIIHGLHPALRKAKPNVM